MINGIIKEGGHLISRVKSNAVAYLPEPEIGKRGRGRPRKYGTKVKLKDLFLETNLKQWPAPFLSLYWSERLTCSKRTIRDGEVYFGNSLPSRGKMILLRSDLDILSKRGYRFKEVAFKAK